MNFTGGSCTSSNLVTGTASGGEITLASVPATPFGAVPIRINAFAVPDASQLMAAELLYSLGPCSAGITAISDYTGTLSRQ